MSFTPRPYQSAAIAAGVDFFKCDRKYNAIEILPTGSGKSVVIANIAKELSKRTLVFQPSKEILGQNLAKFMSYGYRAGVYSASAGQKFVDKITFATIGSVVRKKHLFKDVKHIIIDECDLVNGEAGMYLDFINSIPDAKVLGFTATPYRLTSSFEGSMLTFITNSAPRVFNKVLYYVQNDVLFNAGHLARLEYYSFDVIDRSQLVMNAAGSDFTDASLKSYYRKIKMPQVTIGYANRLLAKRKNLLVFCSLISEAVEVANGIPGAEVLTSDTTDSERASILNRFKKGITRCVINVGVLTVGFDYPELETVLIARSTMSLRLYYQIIGRVMRPHILKDCGYVVDLGGNVDFFGHIETMRIMVNQKGQYAVYNNGKRLTDVSFKKN